MITFLKTYKIYIFFIFLLLLLICYSILNNYSFIQNIVPSQHSQSANNFASNAVFHTTEKNKTSDKLVKYGSYVDGDSTVGSFTSDWYTANGTINIMISGYPANAGNKLEIQFLNSKKSIVYQANNPGETWKEWSFKVNKNEPFRIIAQDQSIQPAGWLGFSLPYKNFVPESILIILQLMLGIYYFLLFLLPGIVLASYIYPLISAKPLFLLLSVAGSFGIGYATFYIYYLNPLLGKICSIVIIILSIILFYIRRTIIVTIFKSSDYIWPLRFVILQSLFYLSVLFSLHTDTEAHVEIQGRFLNNSLQPDNIIPYIFLERIFNGLSVSHFLGDWLSSDRPPLLTGVLALLRALSIFQNPELFYQIMGTFIQSSWIIAIWAIVRNKKWNNTVLFLTLSFITFSGWSLINTNFLWPKISTIPMIILAYILLIQAKRTRADIIIGSLACAFAFLLHGGSIFSILALGIMLLYKTYRLSWKEIGLGILIFIITVLPWTLYQKLADPPGDRLLKWQLAGVIDINNQSFLTTFIEAYRSHSLADIFSFKLSNFITLLPEITKMSNLSEIRFQFFNNFTLVNGIALVGLLSLIIYTSKNYKNIHWSSTPAVPITYQLVLSLCVWCLLLFGPGATQVHQGSYANDVFLFLLLSIALSKSRNWIMLSIYHLNLIVFTSLWWVNNSGSFTSYIWDPLLVGFSVIVFLIIYVYLHFIRVKH